VKVDNTARPCTSKAFVFKCIKSRIPTDRNINHALRGLKYIQIQCKSHPLSKADWKIWQMVTGKSQSKACQSQTTYPSIFGRILSTCTKHARKHVYFINLSGTIHVCQESNIPLQEIGSTCSMWKREQQMINCWCYDTIICLKCCIITKDTECRSNKSLISLTANTGVYFVSGHIVTKSQKGPASKKRGFKENN
jgi:hypothetical protein